MNEANKIYRYSVDILFKYVLVSNALWLLIHYFFYVFIHACYPLKHFIHIVIHFIHIVIHVFDIGVRSVHYSSNIRK